MLRRLRRRWHAWRNPGPPWRYTYPTIKVSGETARQCALDQSSFDCALQLEMAGAMRDMQRELARPVFWDHDPRPVVTCHRLPTPILFPGFWEWMWRIEMFNGRVTTDNWDYDYYEEYD